MYRGQPYAQQDAGFGIETRRQASTGHQNGGSRPMSLVHGNCVRTTALCNFAQAVGM